MCEDFIAEVEALTNGRVKFDYFAGGSLVTAPAMFEGVLTGIADIGLSHVEYSPGRMPVTEVCDMPLGYPSSWVAHHAINDFVLHFKPKEWDDVQVLWMHASNPSLVICKEPVRKLEDLKGLTIRAPGRPGDVLKALGGTPVPTPMMEVYDSIAKGVIQGVFTPYETLKTFKFAEVVDYTTVCWHVGNTYAFYVVMNKDSYNKLKLVPDVKEIFDYLCGVHNERFAVGWNKIDFDGKEWSEELGLEFIELSPAEAARWVEAAAPVIDNYVAEMVGKGYSEAEVRGWIKFLRERIEYWTARQIDLRIPSPTGPDEMRP